MFPPLDDVPILLPFLAAAVVWLAWSRLRGSATRRLPLPPGPRPLPLVGTLADFPLEQAHLRDLSAKYGDILTLNAFGTPIIVLGTHQASLDLLEKRSSIYSDRHWSDMANLTGFDWLFSMMRYGLRWRKARSAFHHCMNPGVVSAYRPIQNAAVKKYLQSLLKDPKDFYEHGRHMIGAIIIRAAYGVEVKDTNDKYVMIADRAMECFNVVFKPGAYLVQTFPWMRHIPSWFPGARFQREFDAWRPTVRMIHDAPWKAAMDARARGQSPICLFTTLMDRGEDQSTAQSAAGTAYMAGADTSLSTLQTFVAAMASYPEVQKRAQDELDLAIGPGRLPTMDDKQSLPYVSAILKECLRWRSVVPLSIPHLSTEEDEYKGYRIPRGSVVVSNTWAYSRDPSFYSDPEAFIPERFLKDGELDDSVQDPAEFVFGYGRRICPGRYFAEGSLFTTMASVLHTFTIEAPKNEKGEHVHLAVEMTDGVVSYPAPFECTFTVRSPAAEALIGITGPEI